jgi:hypothetical protein
MDHFKVHKKMIFKLIVHKLDFESPLLLWFLKILQNDFVHHIRIQVKISNQVLLNKFQYLYKNMGIVIITTFQN